MDAASTVFQAGIGGSLELLALSGAGALLAHFGHFSPSTSISLSNGLYKVFLPALVFSSVIKTVTYATSGRGGTLQDVWVPITAAALIFIVAAVVTFPVVRFLLKEKEEFVRRAIWISLVLGNSNTLPLLVMNSICDCFEPLSTDPECLVRATGFSSLYTIVFTILTWTFLFQYLSSAQDAGVSAEAIPLLENGSTDAQTNYPARTTKFLEPLKRSFLTPPSQAVVWGIVIGCIPRVPGMLVDDHGPLRPALLSISEIGSIAVPLSSVIIGAELYRAMAEPADDGASFENRPSETFGKSTFILTVIVRMVLLPWIGRTIHRALNLTQAIPDSLLSVFVLVQWAVPSANNAIIMVSILAEKMPVMGARVREDISKCLFWQYLTLPVFLTLNTILSLKLQYS